MTYDPNVAPEPLRPPERISHATYLALLGLFALARRCTRQREEIEFAAAELLGLPTDGRNAGDFDWLSDEIIGVDANVPRMLRSWGIRVDKDEAPEQGDAHHEDSTR